MFRTAENIRGLLECPLFYQLMAFVAFLAFTMLFMDQSKDTIDFNIFLALILFSTQCLMNSIAGHFADNLNDDLEYVGEMAYDLNWYKMAQKDRAIVQWLIHRSQKSIRLSGFTIIDCSMATFLKVREIVEIHFFIKSIELNRSFTAFSVGRLLLSHLSKYVQIKLIISSRSI